MASRLDLHKRLCELLGSEHVYFQPPESIKLQYPCIIYSLDTISVRHADNDKYKADKRYSVMVIDKNPDSVLPDKILSLPLCSFDRHYVVDNLHHSIFSLYY